MPVRRQRQPHLAIDLDEVLFPGEKRLALYHNLTYGTHLTTTDMHSAYEYHLVWGGTRQQANRKVAQFRLSDIHAATKPMEGAAEAIHQLAKCYRITIVTARGPKAQQPTLAWIERWLPKEQISEIIFTGNHYERDFIISKTAVCLQNDIDWLIDDAMRYLREAHLAGIKTVKFGTDPYHQGPLDKGILEARSWPEVVRLLT